MKTWKEALVAVVLVSTFLPAARADQASDPAGAARVEGSAAKVKALYGEEEKSLAPLRDELHVAAEKLHWQLDAHAGDKELSDTLARIVQIRSAMRDLQDKLELKIQSVLTPEETARRVLQDISSEPRQDRDPRSGGRRCPDSDRGPGDADSGPSR